MCSPWITGFLSVRFKPSRSACPALMGNLLASRGPVHPASDFQPPWLCSRLLPAATLDTICFTFSIALLWPPTFSSFIVLDLYMIRHLQADVQLPFASSHLNSRQVFLLHISCYPCPLTPSLFILVLTTFVATPPYPQYELLTCVSESWNIILFWACSALPPSHHLFPNCLKNAHLQGKRTIHPDVDHSLISEETAKT